MLEGERRSFDNVKLDLMRRIKMLEYALRVERYVLCIIHACRLFDVSAYQFKTIDAASVCATYQARHNSITKWRWKSEGGFSQPQRGKQWKFTT